MTVVLPVRRMDNTIVPYGPQALIDLQTNTRNHQLFVVELRSYRNPKQLMKFWTLVNIVAEATDRSAEDVRRLVSYRLGFVDVHIDPWGRAHSSPRSIALTASLTQSEFNTFFDHAIDIMSSRILKTGRQDLINRFEEVMAGSAT
jgi:hypothetical protein